MKFNLKMIAIASAMVSMAGAAHADLTAAGSNNSSLALVAFNTVTSSYYMRDTGFLLNNFLPTGVTTLAGDGAVSGNRTPEAGLLLDKNNTATFADASFSGWLAGQTLTDVKWFLNAVDSVSNSGTLSQRRVLTSSMNGAETATNGQVDNFVGNAGAGSLTTQFGTGGLSVTGSGAPTAWGTNFGLGADGLASIGDSANLFYFVRTAYTGGSGTLTAGNKLGNSANFATVTLAANGDFTYSLASAEAPAAVPVPAAAWLLGSGLMALGGAARRRKAAAKA